MPKVFVTDRKNKGLEMVAGKYPFVDGVFVPPSEQHFELLETLLTRYYGVIVEEVEGAATDLSAEMESLVASQTRAAELAGNGASSQAIVETLEATGQTGTFSGSPPDFNEGPVTNASADPTSTDPKVVSDQAPVVKADENGDPVNPDDNDE